MKCHAFYDISAYSGRWESRKKEERGKYCCDIRWWLMKSYSNYTDDDDLHSVHRKFALKTTQIKCHKLIRNFYEEAHCMRWKNPTELSHISTFANHWNASNISLYAFSRRQNFALIQCTHFISYCNLLRNSVSFTYVSFHEWDLFIFSVFIINEAKLSANIEPSKNYQRNCVWRMYKIKWIIKKMKLKKYKIISRNVEHFWQVIFMQFWCIEMWEIDRLFFPHILYLQSIMSMLTRL